MGPLRRVGIAFAWGLAAREAQAAPAPGDAPTIELHWNAPPQCPSADRIHADLARFLAGGARQSDVVTIDATVEAQGDRFSLVLRVQAPAGAIEKTMSADDCKTLASAVALVVAVLLDPAAVVETVEREQTREPVALPTPVVVERPKPAPTPTVRRRKFDVQGFARPFVAGSFGPLPRFGVATGGIVGVRIARARIEVQALWDATQRARASGLDAGAKLDLWAVGLRGCFAPRWRTLEVPVCGGGEVGQIRGQGFGLSQTRHARATWAAVLAGTTLLWVPSRFVALGGGVDGVVALTRPSFIIDDLGRVHRPRAVGVRIHAGVEVRFP